MTVVPIRPRRGQGTDPPAVRPRATISLTEPEARQLRAALKNLRLAYGSWECLAEVMGVNPKTLKAFAGHRRRNASHGLAVAAARAAGTTVEALLGRPRVATTCPHCGASWEVKP